MSHWGRRADGWTDEQTDMTKLIIAFRNFANAPKIKKKILYLCPFPPVTGLQNILQPWQLIQTVSKLDKCVQTNQET